MHALLSRGSRRVFALLIAAFTLAAVSSSASAYRPENDYRVWVVNIGDSPVVRISASPVNQEDWHTYFTGVIYRGDPLRIEIENQDWCRYDINAYTSSGRKAEFRDVNVCESSFIKVRDGYAAGRGRYNPSSGAY